MSDIPSHLCGAIIDPVETDKVCNALAAMGCDPMLDSARPQLKGFWESTGYAPIFLTDADDDTAWFQAHGTCTGQGWGHALQTSIRYSVKFGNRIGAIVNIAWEPLYIAARRIIGKDSLGRGDGACVPWLAQAGYQLGMAVRRPYGSVDLSKPQEDWAVNLSQPRAGQLPQDILKAMSGFKLAAGMKVPNLDIAADALASGYGLVRGADRATGSVRNADGITRTVQCGGHCEHLCIVFKDIKGRRIWGERNSWRGTPSQPHGDATFKLADGSERPVPDGVGGLYDDDVQYYIDHGDLWTAEPPETLWADENKKPSDFA